jgi:hypothetical protein
MNESMKKILRRIAPLALVAVLFSGNAAAAPEKTAAPPVGIGQSPAQALPLANGPVTAAGHSSSRLASEMMMVFGFLGLLLFSASAGTFGKKKPFEARYRSYPYGSFLARKRAERDAA